MLYSKWGVCPFDLQERKPNDGKDAEWLFMTGMGIIKESGIRRCNGNAGAHGLTPPPF